MCSGNNCTRVHERNIGVVQHRAELSQMHEGALSSAAQPCTFSLAGLCFRGQQASLSLPGAGKLNARFLKGFSGIQKEWRAAKLLTCCMLATQREMLKMDFAERFHDVTYFFSL